MNNYFRCQMHPYGQNLVTYTNYMHKLLSLAGFLFMKFLEILKVHTWKWFHSNIMNSLFQWMHNEICMKWSLMYEILYFMHVLWKSPDVLQGWSIGLAGSKYDKCDQICKKGYSTWRLWSSKFIEVDVCGRPTFADFWGFKIMLPLFMPTYNSRRSLCDIW